MDGLIESTGVSYRALRMHGFMDNILQQVESIKSEGMFFSSSSPDHRVPTYATRDIAATAAKLLLDHSWSGQGSVPVLGPKDLSFNDMAQITSEVLERPVRFQQVSGEAYKATLMQHGMTEAWAQGLIDMSAAVQQGIYNAEPRAPQPTPTSFRQWCEEVFKPIVQHLSDLQMSWPRDGPPRAQSRRDFVVFSADFSPAPRHRDAPW